MVSDGQLQLALVPEDTGPLKLDLGCGKNKAEGFLGVDQIAFDNVDLVADLRQPWPWRDDSVAEVRSSHFVEHLDATERIHFFNELWRVLVPGGIAQIITPHWSHACAYGDPTHKWPPLSDWSALYLNKEWRDTQAPHVAYTCDFDFVTGIGWDQRLMPRNEEYRMFAATSQINAVRDWYLNLTKRHGSPR